MPKCGNCGTKFDVEDARSEFDTYHEWAGELTYDDVIDDLSTCADCAIAYAKENLDAGRAMQFSLDTGLPPEDVPDDWSPSAPAMREFDGDPAVAEADLRRASDALHLSEDELAEAEARAEAIQQEPFDGSPELAIKPSYAAFLIAGYRVRRSRRVPFGRPGPGVRDFGGLAGVPSVG
ncbi:MAG TPA: hypothetical protein VIK11_02630, partial [Tepidiformaceae bacterium]